MDGSVDFRRDWDAYVRGFGDPEGEYWLGLENVHKLTKPRTSFADTDLLVALRGRASDGSNMEAPYLDMWIGDGASKYALRVDGFAGGAGVVESMLYHDAKPFSTHDADNDDCSLHCAESFTRGG